MKSKSIVFLLFIFSGTAGISQSVFDCALTDPQVTQSEIQQAGAAFFQPCILLGNSQNFTFNNQSDHLIEAHDYIRLTNGVHLGKFENSGKMHLRLLPKNGFDVVMINYSSLEQVQRFERFELGVQLNSELQTKIDNFVSGAQTTEKINPYLEWEMKVFAEYTAPGSTQPIVIDGFYNKEFASWENDSILQGQDYISDAQYETLGGYTEIADPYPFRIRFAPPKNGTWSCRIKVVVQNELVYESPSFTFKVVESGNPGYVKVGDNKRYLKRDGTFFPLGCNLPWPETTPSSDPELAAYMNYTNEAGENVVFSENFMSKVCIPRVYDKYRNTMQLLANGGANYYRSIMYPSATEIEFEELGNYTARLSMAQEMDEILEHAENLGLFIHWNLQIHYSFQSAANAYSTSWVWSGGNGIEYCYKNVVGEDPKSFLTNETAKTYYKQRLRYILARWGYSTNIAIWELFSEINNLGASAADISDVYQQGNNWQMYRDWQWEMAEYLKSMYHGQVHLVTSNYAGAKHPMDNTFDSPHMDVMTSNIYDFREPSFGEFFIDKVARIMLNENNSESYTYNYTKPLIFSETDPLDASCDPDIIEVKRSLWQSTFSGLAGAFSWEMRKFPEQFSVYGQIRNFIQDVEFDAGGWHPGAVYITFDTFPPSKISWRYSEDRAKYMDRFVDPPGNDNEPRLKKADLMYLRSGDRNLCLGVMTNKTKNIRNTTDCYSLIWPQLWPLDPSDTTYDYSPISAQNGFLDVSTEDLMYTGLHNKEKYYLEYYLLNGNTPIHEQMKKSKNLRIKLDFEFQNAYSYIIPVKLIRKNFSFSIPDDSVSPYEQEVLSRVNETDDDISNYNSFNNKNSNNPKTEISSQLYNMMGQIVDYAYRPHVAISNMPMGTYFLITTYSDGTVSTKKIVVL